MLNMSVARQWIPFCFLVKKEVKRFLRSWVQTLVPPQVIITLYTVVFGYLIGERIGDMAGVPYISFVTPGLIMMAVINNSYANVASSFYTAKFNHSLECLLISPMSVYVMLLGFVCGGVIRGLLVGCLVATASLIFHPFDVHNLATIICAIFLTSLVVSVLALINAIHANSFEGISIIPTMVLTPLIFLGGVFYSIHTLPEFWQNASQLNPVLYMVNTFRYGFIGITDVNLTLSIIGVVMALIVSVAYVVYLVKTGRLHKD